MARYNLDVTGEASAALDRLSEKAGDKAKAIRQAISVADWVDEVQRSGGTILVRDKDGQVKEVLWR